MGIITSDCPHCRAQNMTFSVFGIAAPPQLSAWGRPSTLAAAFCRKCGLPLVVHLGQRAEVVGLQDVESWLRQEAQQDRNLEGERMRRYDQWPHSAAAAIPAFLPEVVERAFRQAEANYASTDCNDAAAIMYRRALELALKLAFPDLKGSLSARIRTLVDDHHLPLTIGDWLTEVRLIGNDGAHEIEGVSRPDLEDARGFVDMALRYIFTLPAQVAARRGS